MRNIITSRNLYYVTLIATFAILVVSFFHISQAVVAFEKNNNLWVANALAGGAELYLTLCGFGIGEIIKYRASQATAPVQHSIPIFPKWMLVTLVVGLVGFTIWILWGNFYYTSVVAVNESLKAAFKGPGEYVWIHVVTWAQIKGVDGFHLFNSYSAALAIPFMGFMGSILQAIFDVAASRIDTNLAKGRRGNGGNTSGNVSGKKTGKRKMAPISGARNSQTGEDEGEPFHGDLAEGTESVIDS